MSSYIERIECAIAKYWPDVDRICAATKASRHEVHTVYVALDRISGGENHETVRAQIRQQVTPPDEMIERCKRGHQMDGANTFISRWGTYCRKCRHENDVQARRARTAREQAERVSGRSGIPTQRQEPAQSTA